MYTPGLGIAPAIIATAVKVLVPAIESLFKSNYTYSFPALKKEIDNWAGTVNLDPTLVTASAQWAWANLRCMAGDTGASDDVTTALALFQIHNLGGFRFRDTPNGPVPVDYVATCASPYPDAVAYAVSAVRVLTVRKEEPKTDLYSGTLPTPVDLPPVDLPEPKPKPSPQSSGSSSGSSSGASDTIGGIPTMYVVAGAAVLAVLVLTQRR